MPEDTSGIKAPIRRTIVVADADENVRSALRLLIGRLPGAVVTGIADSLMSTLETIANARPDVLLLDARLVDGPIGDAIRTVRLTRPGLAIVVLGLYAGDRTAAMEAGSDAFVVKSEGPAALLNALQSVVTRPAATGVQTEQVVRYCPPDTTCRTELE